MRKDDSAMRFLASRWSTTARRAAQHHVVRHATLLPRYPGVPITLLDEPKDRPPNVRWAPSEEFDHSNRTKLIGETEVRSVPGVLLHRAASWAERQLRAARAVLVNRIVTKHTFVHMGGSLAIVAGFGAHEGLLYCANPLVDAAGVWDLEVLSFVTHYSAENILCSCIWSTKSPELVAQALGLDPSLLLRTFEMNPADASIQLRIAGDYTCRSVVAGFTLITQLVRLVNHTARANLQFKQRVLEGTEPPLDNVQGRVIRLCGAESDTTEVALDRYGGHIYPVFEQASKIEWVARKHSENGIIPCFWRVDKGSYGLWWAWAGLKPTAKWLLRTTTAKRILCIEADTTPTEDSLSLIKAQHEADLSVGDALLGFRQLQLNAGLASKTRVLRVVLGNSHQPAISGSGRQYSVRDRAFERGELDVFVDDSAPVLIEVLRWLSSVTAGQKSNNVVCFETPSIEYFEGLRAFMEPLGWKVIDEDEAENLEANPTEALEFNTGLGETLQQPPIVERSASRRPLPRLVYYPQCSSATVAAAYALHKMHDLEMPCCLIVEKAQGAKQLEKMSADSHHRFEVVCPSIIHDDLLRQVRVWARMGYSAKVIQAELDTRFRPIHEVVQERNIVAQQLQAERIMTTIKITK